MIVYGTILAIEKYKNIVLDILKEQKIYSQNNIYASSIEEISNYIDVESVVLVMDPKDIEIIKYLYQHKVRNVYLPVCSRVLSIMDPNADSYFAEILKENDNWKWHKQVNRFKMLRGYLLHKTEVDYKPAHIQLEHTSFCNAKCIMCGHAMYGNKYARNISNQLLTQIESLLPTCELMVLHGYGEPLLTENLVDILKLYHKYDIEVTMNTNLSFLSESLLFQMKDMVKHLRVSCDAATKELYEKIRPGLKYDTFIENTRKIKEVIPKIDLMMESVIMRQNLQQIPMLIKFAHDMDFSQISLNRLGSHPALNNEKDCLYNYPNLTSYYLKKGLMYAKKNNFKVFYPQEWLLEDEDEQIMQNEWDLINKLPFKMPLNIVMAKCKSYIRESDYLKNDSSLLREGKYRCSGICESLIGRTNIDLDGNVFVCCMNTLKKLGNLYETNYEDILNLTTLCKMRKTFYNDIVPKFCNTCSYVMNRTLAFADIWGDKR